MLVRFSSIKTESIIMFGDVAVQLIKVLGASGVIPGAIRAEDIPAAVRRLRQHLQTHTAPNPEPSNAVRDEDNESDREPPVALATRAAPLIDLLERSAAGDAPVMWEAD